MCVVALPFLAALGAGAGASAAGLSTLAALSVGSTALAAGGQILQGVQAKQSANYEAKVDQQNAAMAAQARREAIDQGVINQVREDRKSAQIEGEQRVAMAGAGVDTTFGSAADLSSDSALIASENRQDIVLNTQRQAQSYAVSAWNDQASATAARYKGDSALTGSFMSAGATILGGAMQVKKIGLFQSGKTGFGY